MQICLVVHSSTTPTRARLSSVMASADGAASPGNSLLAELHHERLRRSGAAAPAFSPDDDEVAAVSAVFHAETPPTPPSDEKEEADEEPQAPVSTGAESNTHPGVLHNSMEAVKDALDCPLCMSMFADPITLVCGHSFCRSCFASAVRASTMAPACPVCRAPAPAAPADIGASFALRSVAMALFPHHASQRAAEVVQDAEAASTREVPVMALPGMCFPGQVVTLPVASRGTTWLAQNHLNRDQHLALLPTPGAAAGDQAWCAPGSIGVLVRVTDVEELPAVQFRITATVVTRIRVDGPTTPLPLTDLTMARVCDLQDMPLEQDTLPAAVTAMPGAGEAQGVAPPSTVALAAAYQQVLQQATQRIVGQLGPSGAATLIRHHGHVPSSPQALSFYLAGVLSLPQGSSALCLTTTSTLQRLHTLHTFLASHQSGEDATAPASALVPPIGVLSANDTLRMAQGPEAWMRGAGDALARPNAVQGFIVLIAVFLLLVFFVKHEQQGMYMHMPSHRGRWW